MLSLDLSNAEEELKNFRTRNRNILSSPALLLEENRLVREVASLDQIYTTMKSQYEITKIEEIGSSKFIQVIDEPSVPIFRSSPKRTKSVIQAFFLGFAFSFIVLHFKKFSMDIKRFLLS